MNKRHVHVISSSTGSIGEVTKDLITGLMTFKDLIITREGENKPMEYDILLCHFLMPMMFNDPENFKTFDLFKFKILIQPIDGTDIIPEVIDALNKFDMIITPGKAGMKIMKKNGVVVPIRVIPNFYKQSDLDVYKRIIISHPKLTPYLNKIVFYHESTFHPRKGVDKLYEAFIKAFSDTDAADNVVLICKDQPFNKRTFKEIEISKKEAIKLQKKYKKPAQIVKISQHLEWIQMMELWKLADIYVSLSKIEGFGIPLLRMAVLEKDIIALDNPLSGYMDFLPEKKKYLIPAVEKKAQGEFMWLYGENSTWMEAEVNDIVQVFKEAYYNFTSIKGINNLKEINYSFDVQGKYELFNIAKMYRKALLGLKHKN